jgi:hypothetical protein
LQVVVGSNESLEELFMSLRGPASEHESSTCACTLCMSIRDANTLFSCPHLQFCRKLITIHTVDQEDTHDGMHAQ